MRLFNTIEERLRKWLKSVLAPQTNITVFEVKNEIWDLVDKSEEEAPSIIDEINLKIILLVSWWFSKEAWIWDNEILDIIIKKYDEIRQWIDKTEDIDDLTWLKLNIYYMFDVRKDIFKEWENITKIFNEFLKISNNRIDYLNYVKKAWINYTS